ncbi:putative immunity/bacteriocin fusion bifunctional protein [Bacillus spizizenii]|uniref:putative immunity/bacteriocin fusion bifunctional protein n=1 Tax=Bacillus spizizenii TaxID=96241 RepID=UPI001F62585F|nr:putative immunity/bacteriocin fusion bifunctional protein [Bacillus spizizenii]MCI4170048.1 putative immunity/bacteriocin fusion bifunctional protein [Bacillus spizizenii]MEC1434471.1 putative immunity/bacteriocin fusion bifunctional protein [Bacillus spizizenii]MEC1527980.1 putative immunity/bacteriocin fusion bifunctional protein [Bacillus spizizenii]MEC1584614.1 putative immunity/bacteriocin fusion bifunctional protein [Bacillus spizizenii]MEC2183214.1 putative immunity/bacteriocin fusio
MGKKGFFSLLMAFTLSLVTIFSFNTSVKANSNVFGKAKTNCESCQSGVPKSSGSKEDQQKAKEIVYASKEFKQNKLVKKPEKSLFGLSNEQDEEIVNVKEGMAVVTIPVEDMESGLTSAQYFVDLNTEQIFDTIETYITFDESTKLLNLQIKQSGEITEDVKLTEGGKVKLNDGTEVSVEDYLKGSESAEETKASTMMSCKSAVSWLYDIANGGSCALSCLRVAAINLAIGIGCGAVCVIIKNNSKSKAIKLICG